MCTVEGRGDNNTKFNDTTGCLTTYDNAACQPDNDGVDCTLGFCVGSNAGGDAVTGCESQQVDSECDDGQDCTTEGALQRTA